MRTTAIVQRELIGLSVEVIQSTHPSNVGIQGKVLDETRNSLVIRHNNRRKIVIKNTATFDFRLPHGTRIEIDGKVLMGRPEDRLKKQIKRLW